MKYIIEFEDVPSFAEDGIAYYQCKQAPWWYSGDTLIGKLTPVQDISPEIDKIDKKVEKLKSYEAEQGHSDTIDESYTIGYKQANNNSKSNTECDGCLYDDGIKEHSLCHTCSNAYINHWTAKKQDEIEVGDEVEVLNSGNKYLIAWFAGTSLCGFAHGGVTCRLQPSDVRKTGRHFDIEKILEEMRE